MNDLSAFLGPIHFWLYDKIGNQELLTKAIADYAVEQGWVSRPDDYTKVLPPLEAVIDEGNIHGWLQNQITDAETRYARLIIEILAEDGKRIDALCSVAYRYGKGHALNAEDAETVYKAFEDFFVNGMPCDRVNALTESRPERVSWEMTQNIHAQYWNGASDVYYRLRKRVMDGMLESTPCMITSSDNRIYRIERKS